MKILLGAALGALFSFATPAFADPVMSYQCTGFSKFVGSVVLQRDTTPSFGGVDNTYFGFASQHRGSGGISALVMMTVGRNNNEPDMNRVCFAWILGNGPKAGQAVSASLSSDDACSGYTSKIGVPMSIVGNSAGGVFTCTVKVSR